MEQGDRKTGRFSYLSETIIGACIEVHRHLGPGLLESAYEQCLAHELELQRLRFARQLAIPVAYKGCLIDCGYRIDFMIENSIVVELKAVENLLPVHQAQVLTYLKLTRLSVGLLVNFNVRVLKDGLRRLTRKDRSSLPVFLSPCSIPAPGSLSSQSSAHLVIKDLTNDQTGRTAGVRQRFTRG